MWQVARKFYHRAFYGFVKAVCFIVFKIIWRLRVVGEENVPRSGAVIIAANHRSLSDPPLVGVSTRRTVHFLAKEELFRFPPFGWLIRNLNAHPLKRGSGDINAFKTARRILANGEALILFPEGRRSKSDDIAKGRPGVGMLSALADCPIVPTYVHNSGWLRQLKRITVVFGPPIKPPTSQTYQETADAVMAEIGRLKNMVG